MHLISGVPISLDIHFRDLGIVGVVHYTADGHSSLARTFFWFLFDHAAIPSHVLYIVTRAQGLVDPRYIHT